MLVQLLPSIFAGLAVIGAAWFGYRVNSKTGHISEIDLAQRMQENRIKELADDKRDLQSRLTNADSRMNQLQTEVSSCHQERDLDKRRIEVLELQVETLKMRLDEYNGRPH